MTTASTTTATRLKKWNGLLNRPVDASSLAVFRILFGAIMVDQVFRFWIHEAPYFSHPFFHFPFLPFVRPLPGNAIYWHLAVIALAALCLCLGLFYRVAGVVFFISYLYFFLLDKTLYNNHYYLTALIALLLIPMGAQRWASLDGWRRPQVATGRVPFWNVFLLRAQFFLVYFFGGVAKLNRDWLHGEPIRHWLQQLQETSTLASFLGVEKGVWFFCYGGLLFDLTIGFLLCWKKTRPFAVCGVLFFNVTNNWLFHIGVFPYLMIAATVVFLEPDTPRRFFGRLRSAFGSSAPFIPRERSPEGRVGGSLAVCLISLYLLLQILIPLRHWLFAGDVAWTEEGHYFSWRMKLRHKQGLIRLTLTDPKTNETKDIDLSEDLIPSQIDEMAVKPDLIWQYAQFLKRKLQSEGMERPIIKAETSVTLNFGLPKALIDPNINLAEVDYPWFGHADWILPAPHASP